MFAYTTEPFLSSQVSEYEKIQPQEIYTDLLLQAEASMERVLQISHENTCVGLPF